MTEGEQAARIARLFVISLLLSLIFAFVAGFLIAWVGRA